MNRIIPAVGISATLSLAVSSHASNIVDWGGDYVTSNQVFAGGAGSTANGDFNADAIALDQRRWVAYSTTTPRSPASGYAAPAGKSATFYGGTMIERFGTSAQVAVDPFINTSVAVIQNAAGDRIRTAVRDGQERGYSVVLFDKADFLAGTPGTDTYTFDANSKLSLAIADINSSNIRFVVQDNGNTYVSSTFTTSQADVAPSALTWFSWTFDSANTAAGAGSLKIVSPLAASPAFTDIAAVGYVMSATNSNNYAVVSGFTVDASTASGTPQWNNAAGGTYNEPANWVGGVPNGIGAVANFLAVGATNPITVDAAVVLGAINFNNAAAYTINGPQGITLQSATTAAVNVIAGSHTINAPITLGSAAGVDVATGLTLTTNTLVGPFAVTKTGTGVLAANKIDVGSLDIAGGTVRLIDSGTGIEGDVNGLGTNGGNGGTVGAGSTSVVTGLTLAGPTTAPTSTLDIRNNDLVVRAAAVNIDSVRDQVAFAYNSGLWDRPGITSSRAAADGLAVGFGSNLDLGYTVFSGVATGTDDFVVKYTWFGDANLDGQVDGDDYLLWLAVFGSSGSGIGWGQGDFDYDQEVDGDDYLLWLQNFGNGLGSPLAVPEPGVMGMAAVVGAGLLARRRRSAR